ncbi:MAG: tyrosine-type recombinase/integrase [Verrucomicrobia bacterium]|jgi:integrase/recombinase XerD|uniref:tyrosine-type recombinase/integrase n=1 Tax=Prosthecobacter sp. TaxID=1965333 RepID=UPI001A03B19D|nr:tyrosine-type recombinase/integrase [Prosthecobacter sp.]MBE2285286.1 tyrosine-type recombinase/integrase [Prosthecobacter sp.]MBN8421407.1 tyrosine-type recombinase/integrase [Verrucomicrobiota bacterium]
MVNGSSGLVVETSKRLLTASEFQNLANVPPEVEWFANIENANTRRAYKNDVQEFMRFAGIHQAEEFRLVKRSHLIAWRKQLETRTLEASTVRRKLSAVASLFDYLCECNAVPFNPADGVKRPNQGTNEGKSPALGDAEAKALLEAPAPDTLKGLRDRAILSILLFHGLRRAELCSLAVGDLQSRRGVLHFRVHGKGGKIRFLPVHPHSLQRISEYLEHAGHGDKPGSALFRPIKNSSGSLDEALTGHGVYKDVVRKYARVLGLDPSAVCVHGLRATAATNALDHEADIAKVQEWLGHASIATTRLYDRRKTKPEDSPTFKVSY